VADTGGKAMLDRLLELPPKRSARGTVAKYRHLMRSGRGRSFLERADVGGTDRTRKKWVSGETKPSKANQTAINQAYEEWQRSNLKARASKGGKRVEVYPDKQVVQQSNNAMSGDPVWVSLSPDEWDRMIKAAMTGDVATADRIWNGVVGRELMGSPPGRAYRTVSHVWFGG
jgi:hypothetical protein